MFSEDMLRHHVDMPWMAKPYFYSSDIRGLHRAKLSPFQKKFYAKLYMLRIVEQKRFVVCGAKYTENLKRFHRLQDEYLLLVNNDIKSVVELVDFIGGQEEKIQQIVADREIEIPGMDEETEVEEVAAVVVESDANIEVMNPNNNQNEIGRQREQVDSARKQETDLDGIGIPETLNLSDVNVARVGESMTDVTDKNEFVETREPEPVDKADWIVRRISELGGYENVSDSVKADIFGFDIADASGSIRLFSDVMKKLGIERDGDELYEEFQRIYDETVSRDADKERAEDKMWNRGRGR